MKIDSDFLPQWKAYIVQSSYAALSVFIITLIPSENTVVIASIGATAFIVFTLPNNISAEPKRIIGGHFLVFFIGSCFAVFPFMHILLFKAIWFALSIGFTILLMVVLDFEHPPAAGTALGMTLVGYSSSAAIAIIISVFLLTIVAYLTKPYLEDLV